MVVTATLIIINDTVRATAVRWANVAPIGTTVKFIKPKRTLSQNNRMWAMLTDVATQTTLRGNKLTPERWKYVFMQALGHELEFQEGIEPGQYFPIGHSTKALSKEKMGELMDYIECFGSEQGVMFKGQE